MSAAKFIWHKNLLSFASFLYTFADQCILFTASQIWELAEGKTNTMELAEAVDNSDLEAFGFTDDFIFELWGAITDAKSGRAKKGGNNNF